MWSDAQARYLGTGHGQACTVEAFGADDDASMGVDHTSAFNCRPITGGQGWSEHSYRVAIDCNPRENPYVSATRW